MHLLLLIVGRAAPTLSAILCVRRRSLARVCGSYCHHPHAVRTRASTKGHRARLHQGASAKEPVKIRQGQPERAAATLRFPLGTRFVRGQPLRQIVSRACHGARAASRACLLVRPHPYEEQRRVWVQSSAHHTTGRPRARGLRVRSFNFSSSTVGDVKARVAATALSHAPGGFCATNRRPFARALARRDVGKSARVPIRRCLLEPQRLDTSDPKHASRDEPS